jgi:preprotein translocase subunit SecG
MDSFFDYAIVVSAVLVALLILIQTRGASLGAGFGSGGEVNTVRRGAEKSLHQITIVMVVVFALSLIFSVLD